MIDEELDAFLEHHGIKGQRWGVRNLARANLNRHYRAKSRKTAKRKAKNRNKAKSSGRTIAEQKQRHEQRVKIAKQAATIALGATYIALRIAMISNELKAKGGNAGGFAGGFKGNRQGFAPPPPSHTQSAKDFIKSQRDTQMYSLKRMHAEGKMDAEQFANFSKKLNDRFDRKLVGL